MEAKRKEKKINEERFLELTNQYLENKPTKVLT